MKSVKSMVFLGFAAVLCAAALQTDGPLIEAARNGDVEAVRSLLAEGADVLVYAAQYLPREMKKFKGWGHSDWKEGVRIAKECKVKKLVLFHHDPDRTDKQMDELQRAARKHFGKVVAAKEGLTLKL